MTAPGDGHTWASRPWSAEEQAAHTAALDAIVSPDITWSDGTPVEGPADAPGSRLSEETRAILRAETARRLHRTEAAIAGSSEEERLGLASWLGGMLRRPPLDNPTPAWSAMRALVDALWWDLADRTPDPVEPLAMHPRLDDSNPWGSP